MVKSTRSRKKIKGLLALHFEQHPHEVENFWKYHIYRGANSHVGAIQYFGNNIFFGSILCVLS